MSNQRDRIEPYLGRLFGYAVSLTGDRERARDLVQDCALRALASRRRPDDDRAYRAWLFRIVRNAFIDGERRAGRLEVQIDDPEPAIEDTELWRFDERIISGLTVRVAMGKLSSPHREVIALVDIAGFSYAETADLIGVPVGTVMSRLSRARHALLEAVEAGNIRAIPIQARKTAK